MRTDNNQISGFGSLHELFIQSMIPGYENRLGENNMQVLLISVLFDQNRRDVLPKLRG